MELHFGSLMQLIFPFSEDERIVACCTPDLFVQKMDVRHMYEHTDALAAFSDPQIRAAIHLVKFHNNRHALRLLGALLSAYVDTNLGPDTCIIPVPLSKRRRMKRGYNQVELIVREALKKHPHQIVYTDILCKTIHTQPQTSLTKTERMHNIRGAFNADQKHSARVQDSHIILVDDVVTTGTTLTQARNALLQLQPKSVRCVALAH